MPTTLRLVTAYVCAISRLMISLAQPGNTQKEGFRSFDLPGVEKGANLMGTELA